MENRAHALVAGLFTVVLGVALAVAGWLFTRGDDSRLVPYLVTTTSSVTGLKVDSPVRYRGVEIGKVDSVKLSREKSGTIEIRILIDRDTPIDRSTYAQLGFLGVTGLAFIALSDNGRAQPGVREQIAAIPLKPSILDSGEDLLATISGIAEKIRDIMGGDFSQRVKNTLVHVERTTERAAVVAAQLAPGAAQLPSLIAATRDTMQAARGMVGAAQGAIAKADTLISNTNALALKLDSRLDAINSMAATAEEVGAAARTLQIDTLPRFNNVAEDLVRKTRSLDRFVQTLSDQPQSLVFGASGPAPGPGEPGFSAVGAR